MDNLTQEEISALALVIDLALDDQWHYLSMGDPELASVVAHTIAEYWTRIASACMKMGFPTMSERCTNLAQAYRDYI